VASKSFPSINSSLLGLICRPPPTHRVTLGSPVLEESGAGPRRSAWCSVPHTGRPRAGHSGASGSGPSPSLAAVGSPPHPSVGQRTLLGPRSRFGDRPATQRALNRPWRLEGRSKWRPTASAHTPARRPLRYQSLRERLVAFELGTPEVHHRCLERAIELPSDNLRISNLSGEVGPEGMPEHAGGERASESRGLPRFTEEAEVGSPRTGIIAHPLHDWHRPRDRVALPRPAPDSPM
jgi:hypothetical protein